MRREQQHTSDLLNENRIIKRLSLISILGNILLSAFKLFAGITGYSGAMISDAVHSMSDVFTTFIAFLGVRMSKKAADKEHPYGHDRMECVAALILGVILFITGIGIGKAGLSTMIVGNHQNPKTPGMIALTAALLSIAVKEGMFRYTRYYARLLNSPAFLADAWHHRSDALSSVGSFLGVGGAMLGFPVLDSVASLGICLCILKVSYDILKDALQKMLDDSCGEPFEKELTNFIQHQSDHITIDLIRTRRFGNKIYVDLELGMDAAATVSASHALAEHIHDSIEEQYQDVKHVMIHVNPA